MSNINNTNLKSYCNRANEQKDGVMQNVSWHRTAYNMIKQSKCTAFLEMPPQYMLSSCATESLQQTTAETSLNKLTQIT